MAPSESASASVATQHLGMAAYHALLAHRVRYFGPLAPLDLLV